VHQKYCCVNKKPALSLNSSRHVYIPYQYFSPRAVLGTLPQFHHPKQNTNYFNSHHRTCHSFHNYPPFIFQWLLQAPPPWRHSILHFSNGVFLYGPQNT